MNDKLELHSRLTEAEILKNFEEIDFFSCLMESLEEARDFAQGRPHNGTVVHQLETDSAEND